MPSPADRRTSASPAPAEASDLPPEILEEYGRARGDARDGHLCQAPFNNIYFNISGQAAPCWLTLDARDSYPQKSIREIWFGEKFQSIREAIRRKQLGTTCRVCKRNLMNRSFLSVLARLYDLDHPLTDYPAVIEFELSNTCNLECVMCKGELSSSIRKNRDHLPPIVTPYDDAFVEQLDEFLPHLKEAKFVGGEPFLIPIYYRIWDRIAALNPGIQITITTNGNVLTRRVQDLLEKLNVALILSIDAVSKETYEGIRVNGKHERVMKNFGFFREYTRRKGTYMQVSVNPLRRNWRELNACVDFCNENDVRIWFNTVVFPHQEALRTLPVEQLREVQAFLASHPPKPRSPGTSEEIHAQNEHTYRNLVDRQIPAWICDADEREAAKRDLAGSGAHGSRSLLERALKEYLHTDDYLSPGNRTQTEARYLGKLAEIREAASGEPGADEIDRRLFLLPATVCVEYLESKSSLEIIEALRQQD